MEREMETNLDSFFKTSKTKEQEGTWFPVTKDVQFKMKRFGGWNSKEIQKVVAAHHAPHSKQLALGILSEEKERQLHTKAFVESTIVDWSGIIIDGEAVPFSVELAVQTLVEMPDLLEALIKEASDKDNFKEDLGNS